MSLKNLKYDPSLDVLRGIAVLLVLSSHFLKEYWYISALGTYGVTLFFILSGYLISGILINVKEQFSHDPRTTIWRTGVFRTFYIRRALRILPLYYSVLLLLVLLDVSAARENWEHYFFSGQIIFILTDMDTAVFPISGRLRWKNSFTWYGRL